MTELNTLMSSSFVRVKLVAFVHFIFIVNATMDHAASSYIFYNILFLIALFWTMQCKESVEAIHSAVMINACSIIFDLIYIVTFYYRLNGWAIAFTIINLICRPFSLILLHRELTERGGTLSTATIFPTNQQRTYEDIDRPNQPVPTNNSQPPNIASIC